MKDKDQNAFASQLPYEIRYKDEDEYRGLSAVEYAAIHLKVPKSGTPWLDEMIEEANRQDLAGVLMQGMAASVFWSENFTSNEGSIKRVTDVAIQSANILIEQLKTAK